ncbi:glycosyl transferase [Opitutaceae bacterium TAV4]|nr:glycosyl transferase [Opitutaceae bacterium TAV4]RRJ99116.1 glycosyl transferase [Opitutaceae bacterium TAV3]RRK00491.1 glycosyl transferase [Opitutaceae bacterium TAV3]
MNSKTIVTLKWGTLYGPGFVNRLWRAVGRHLPSPYRFVCFTDNPDGLYPEIEALPLPPIDLPADKLNTGWRKLCLFGPDAPLSGPCLFLDLDIVIVGDMERFFTWKTDTDCIPIIHNWVAWHKALLRRRPAVGNSSVFRFEGGKCGFIWEQFHREKEWALANFQPPQTYLTHCIRSRMTYWPAKWVRSFKRHCRPAFPLNLFLSAWRPSKACSIVAFHGRPNPDEAAVGFDDGKLRHRVLRTPWVNEHWR